MSDSFVTRGLWPARLLCPWAFPGKNIGVGSRFLLQGIFLTQGSNPRLVHWRAGSLPLSLEGSPRKGLCSEKRLFPLVLSLVQFPHQVENICSQVLWVQKENHKKNADFPCSSPQGREGKSIVEAFCYRHRENVTIKSPAAWSTSHLIIFNMPRGSTLSSKH